jgi:hypothetical protein
MSTRPPCHRHAHFLFFSFLFFLLSLFSFFSAAEAWIPVVEGPGPCRARSSRVHQSSSLQVGLAVKRKIYYRESSESKTPALWQRRDSLVHVRASSTRRFLAARDRAVAARIEEPRDLRGHESPKSSRDSLHLPSFPLEPSVNFERWRTYSTTATELDLLRTITQTQTGRQAGRQPTERYGCRTLHAQGPGQPP